MADQQDVLDNFVAITGVDDTAAALGILEATNWILEDAVNLFYSTQGDAAPAARDNTDEAMARRLQEEAASAEDDVRAPLPTKVERLYSDDEATIEALRARALRQQQQQQAQVPVDAFRDYRAEGEGGASGSQPSRISDLFKPPSDLMFKGDFEGAKEEAREAGKWLLVNLQSTTEFDSHRLNRDTWSHDALKEMLKGMFVFFQAYDNTDIGARVSAFYKIYQFPIIMVVDPLTGAKLLEKHGYQEPEKLIEDLVPYMDHGPTDPGAGFLAQTSLKRKHAEQPKANAGPAVDAEQDPELAAAIAASLQMLGGPSSAGANGYDDMDVDEDEIYAQIAAAEKKAAEPPPPPPKTPEELQQEAAARLPAEPAETDPAGCRVAVRLPEGQRQQRRFAKTDTVQALHDWCISLSAAAAAGRRFSLVPATPGAAPISEASQTLDAAGVAGSMLNMKLEDA